MSTQTQNALPDDAQLGTPRCELSENYGPLTFERFLHSLEASPRLLDSVARNSHGLPRYQTALRRWKELGYPHPGDWPDSDGVHSMPMLPYLNRWLKQMEATS